MQMKFNAILIASLLCVGGIGCSTIGRQVSLQALAKVETGKTTKAELIRLVGEPTSSHAKNGRTVLVYRYQKSGGLSTRLEIFSALVDEQDRVQATHSFKRILKLSDPGTHANQVATKAKFDKAVASINRGATVIGDLTAIFGPPDAECLSVDGRIEYTWMTWDRYYSFSNEMLCLLTVRFDAAGHVEDYQVSERLVR